MQRRKPLSAKQRKEQLQLKRAVKRGDVPPPPPAKPDRHRKGRRGPTGRPLAPPGASTDPSRPAASAADASRRLESSFVKLPPAFLERTKALAASLPLARPIPSDRAILPDVDEKPADAPDASHAQLTCPKRPKWRYDMSKKEVEANEHGLFKKWLAQTDAAVHAWSDAPSTGPIHVGHNPSSPSPAAREVLTATGDGAAAERMPRAPTSAFERNLEVWRQLYVPSRRPLSVSVNRYPAAEC